MKEEINLKEYPDWEIGTEFCVAYDGEVYDPKNLLKLFVEKDRDKWEPVQDKKLEVGKKYRMNETASGYCGEWLVKELREEPITFTIVGENNWKYDIKSDRYLVCKKTNSFPI